MPAEIPPVDPLRTAVNPNACLDEIADLPGSHFDVVLDMTNWVTLGMEQRRFTPERRTIQRGGVR